MRSQTSCSPAVQPLFFWCLLVFLLVSSFLCAADLDGDGLDDAWESANGCDPSTVTRVVYVDAVNGDDGTGDGVSAATALKSLGAALGMEFSEGGEVVVLVAPGTYCGAGNRELDFGGRDIRLRSLGGASQTVVDLEGAGRFLSLTGGETLSSVLEGFTVRNGYRASNGTAVHLSNSSLTIRDCVFEDNRSGKKVEYDYGTWTYVQLMDAQSTAAVYAEGASVRISGTVFRRNASAETMYSSMGPDNAGALLLSNADGSIVEECQFLGNSGHGGGAVALHGTDVTFRGCTFYRNISLYYGGGLSAFQARNSGTNAMEGCDVILENCLFLENKAFQDYSDLYFGTGTAATLKHITASGGTSKNGNALRFGGETAVTNSILDGKVSLENGIVFVADHCCARESLSAYGEGNLQGDPFLSGAGWLLSSSVCRGAGGAAGFLSSDIAGNPRSETVVDLGCRAFVDTDADGIPDDVEIAAGLDSSNAADVTGDRDGDGVLNLREYELGMDLDNADTDGDGISDATELSQGLDPLWPARFLFVTPMGDDENDGLSWESAKATLSAAVESAQQCGWDNVVELSAGEYSGEGFRGLDFGGYDIIVRGAGSSATVVDLGSAGRFLRASGCETAASCVEGVTLRNGSGDSGSAISVSGAALTLRRCAIEDCAASWFGTFFVSNAGRLCVEECAFHGNTAYYGGAIAAQGEASLSVTDSEMRGNTATSDGGALYLDCASAEVSASRFLYNHAAGRGGGITLSGDAALEMTNCLAIGNSAADGSRDLHCDSSLTSVSLTNCTFADDAGGGVSCSLQGQMELLNCAFAGEVAFNGGQPSASHNCTAADWSQHGTGNVAADPALTSSGLPRAGSPCIDAGDGFVAPEKDIDGRSRPSGTAVDIGCFEFQDTDADGIPDAVEELADISPDGDEDGDGLVNLREYLLGTDIFQADTDGDGMNDGEEVSGGYDPLLVTRVTYVDPVAGDDANDGRSAENAKRTLSAAVEISRRAGCENVILAAPGVYAGAANRGLDFNGYDIRVVSSAGASQTIVDLEGTGRLLSLTKHESLASSFEGFTVRNGYMASNGTAVHLNGASLTIRDCVFENNCSGRLETYDTGNGQTYSNWEGGYSSAAVYSSNGKVRITGSVFRNNASHNTTGAGMDTGSAGAILLCNADGCEIEECDFVGNSGYGAGAIVASNASLEVRRSRFLHNFSYSDGGAVSAPEGWYYYGSDAFENGIVLENCLFLGNRALQDFSDLDVADERSLVTLRNTTISGGSAKSGHALRLAGTATVANCIVEGMTTLDADLVLSASNNCVGDDWNTYGSGNFVGEPKLTGAGMLKSGSPCVDAGTSIGAPAEDLFGNARPVGEGVDIGCHEFQDEDSDGIADFCEGVEGVLPGGDEDGDGLTNLEEYLLGTDIFKADTEGDGMDDGEEMTNGRDPLLFANVVYVSPSGDDESDGRSPATAKATFAAALEVAQQYGTENIVYAAAGSYAGQGNSSLNFEGYDIAICGATGEERPVIDLVEGNTFLALSQGESCRSCLKGLSFVRNRGDSPAIVLNGASLTVIDCSFRSFARSEAVESYMCYDYDFTTAGVLRGQDATCRLECVEVAYCSYHPARPLFVGVQSDFTLEGCRIVGNETGSAPLFRLHDSQVRMENTMLSKNNVSSAGGIAFLCGSTLLRTVNSTLAENASSATSAIYGGGIVEMLNTIYEGRFSECEVSLSHCFVAPEYADASSGCISGEAALAGGLFLTSDSPCIDAGLVLGAPAVDFAGTPRPQGAGVDIGCEEYRDSNGDGISDFYSAWCGGDLTPDGDLDGDGLSNLQEMLLGTDAATADTDGDGMSDGWEVLVGLSPLYDDADEDPDDDGLLNVEEFAACTNPMEADTDGDGQTDGWEVRTAFSDPTAADFNGVSDAVLEVAGSLFTDSGGGWDAVEGGACARGRSGWIQYSVQVPREGVYLLEWNVSEAGTSSAGAFTVSCRVDGASCGALLRIPLDESQMGTGVFMAPFLSTGLHTVRLDWDNVYRNTSLRVDSLRMIELGGPDADDDGVPDWVETRLANMSCTALPERSRVSPVCVEGANASYIEAIDVSGYYVAPEEEDPQPAIRRITGNRWWVDLPLSPDDATPVTVSVSYQNSAMTISGNILWETVDTTTLDEDTVRLNDEMLFCADLPESVEEWTLGIGGESHPMERGAVFRHKFEVAGDVAISASWTEVDGTECSNEAVIHVLSADFGSEPICHVGTERTWRVSGVGADIPVEIDRDVQSTDLGCSDGGRRFLLRGTVPAVAYATARVREGGAVLDTTAVHVVETTTHLGDGYHRVIADYGDGTVLYDGYVVVGQVVEGMSVTVTLWGTNSTFEDGTQEKTFTWESFDASGELHFSILGGRAFTTCMTVVLYQDDEVVWRLQ
jgi:predicted outer membrane repeat protein